MAHILGADGKIDATNPDNLSDKVVPERETRKRFLTVAREKGFEKEMMLLFAEADKMMRLCGNDKERHDIAQLYSVKAYRLLGGGGELYVDGQLVCKED